ncbi:Eco57I restriction-modification methylase domain-containing protein [Paracoccus alkenifer]|uniref:site-specific DNA-methyltransferase (adenine-specific) n=1 Tax=Paracoccus alkenifer TaxID=65735 RepID=A0A1H6JES7_9RHOB|nr:Eco57I restriction-modification methylase domain-containing protein [Paracoccus alkenifer]SEH60753.1 TaqI-like C-terminal specificity domain-containing protein [Paracoccus alkenifer]
MTVSLALQPAFGGLCPVTQAVEELATGGGIEERGAIFTKREVVEFILDLTGYTESAPLTKFRLLEPSFGNGDFLLPAINRLLAAAARDGQLTFEALAPAICAVELHRTTFEATRALLTQTLIKGGLSRQEAARLCSIWLIQGDFLLANLPNEFTHVVGNPPYVRQESVPAALINEYRKRFQTIYDRADIYVPFIERSLTLLARGGRLGFICADRWMKNKYGKKLRKLVSENYALTTYVDMYGVDAFHVEVNAYPAIAIIERSRCNKTRVFPRPPLDAQTLKTIAADLTASKLPKASEVREIENVTVGDEPWVLESFDELALVRRLEAQFPALEDAGCKVGIGVATGADNAFIGDLDALDVESSRKLPLVMTRDIRNGYVAWCGKGIINPFGKDGKLVNLEDFPRLNAYLKARKNQIAGRHVAEKNPRNWYRTIDRIYPELARREKLLIPDIKGDASIVYECGKLYPHHNLYYIISDEWDIHALQAVMRSGIARLFVALYCTRMRGGYLRFQAQYLRKIRIPKWSDVSEDLRQRLADYAETNNRHALNEIISELYGLDPHELKLIEGKIEE